MPVKNYNPLSQVGFEQLTRLKTRKTQIYRNPILKKKSISPLWVTLHGQGARWHATPYFMGFTAQ